jgi:DNA-binding response OmpR family regulator
MKKILLIEDDRYLTDDLQYFIEDAGNKCKVYSTADQVMENFDSIEDYDIIVLDIMMMKGEKIKTVDKDLRGINLLKTCCD